MHILNFTCQYLWDFNSLSGLFPSRRETLSPYDSLPDIVMIIPRLTDLDRAITPPQSTSTL